MMGTLESSGFFATEIELRRFSFQRLPAEDVSADPDRIVPLTPPRLRLWSRVSIDRDQRLLQVISEMTTVEPGENDPKPAVRIEAEIVSEFTWEGETSLDVAAFARHNAPAFAWPYLRELVWNFSVRGNTPPLLLPLVNFMAEGVDVTEERVTPL